MKKLYAEDFLRIKFQSTGTPKKSQNFFLGNALSFCQKQKRWLFLLQYVSTCANNSAETWFYIKTWWTSHFLLLLDRYPWLKFWNLFFANVKPRWTVVMITSKSHRFNCKTRKFGSLQHMYHLTLLLPRDTTRYIHHFLQVSLPAL